MPYGERTVRELMESAEITPMGIQLEVNAEIFTVIRNLLAGMRDASDISADDDATLYNLWRRTVREMAKVELRAGYGIPMEEQIAMLRQAFDIESKYISDQVFHPITGIKLTKKLIEKESAFDEDEMRLLFEEKVWPSIAVNKSGDLPNPAAYIVAGQPGSGKTRMSSVVIEEYNADIIQSMGDNFRGFHPRYQKLLKKYGQYCAYFTLPQAKFLSELTLHRAAEGRYNIIQEGALENVKHTMEMIEFLKRKGYTVVIMLRACPRKKSWKAIHQLFLQQRLKAPGLSRLITKECHDAACLSFLSATNDLIKQNLMDRLIIKSPKGLLYDSDDMPTESVANILAKRMKQ